MLQSHYRSPVDFSGDSLAEARTGMDRFYETLKKIKDNLGKETDFSNISPRNLSGKDEEVFEKVNILPEKFAEAMDDDFNTAKAIGYIFDTIRMINGYMADKEFVLTSESLFVLDSARNNVREVGKILGLFLEDPDEYFEKDKKREAGKLSLDVEEIVSLIEERREARVAKDWARADEIRDILAAKKVVLKDTADSTTWKIG